MLPARSARLVVALAAIFLTQTGATVHASGVDAPDYRGPIGLPPVDPLGGPTQDGAAPATDPGPRLSGVGAPDYRGPLGQPPVATRVGLAARSQPAPPVISCFVGGPIDTDWTGWWQANASRFVDLPAQIYGRLDVPVIRDGCALAPGLTR